MNVSSACSQCGAIANPTDRFCNTCGSPLNRQAPQPAQPAQAAPAPQPAPPPAYGAPPPQYAPQAYAPPQAAQPQAAPPQAAPQYGGQVARCQLGHEIAQGASYCAQGHPIALDAMQFANDPNAYARQQQQQLQQQQAAPQGYGAPAAAPGLGFGAPQGFPPPQPQAYQPPPQPQYAPPQPQQYAPPQPPQQQAYAPPQPYAPPAPAPQGVFQPAAVPPPGAQPQYVPPPAPTNDARPEPPAGTKMLRGFVVSFQTNPGGDFWPLGTGRVTVGRSNAGEPAEIALADATISSRHAVFVVDAASIVVEDTASTNGTYVNEEHIGQNGRRELRDGDRVRFGGFTTLVKILGRL